MAGHQYAMWSVYILKSIERKWYYVGSSNRLEERLKEHNAGRVKSTKAFLPLEIVYSELYTTEYEARSREQELKKKRKEKERIIRELEK